MEELVPESYYPGPNSSLCPLCPKEFAPWTRYYCLNSEVILEGCQFLKMHICMNILQKFKVLEKLYFRYNLVL